MCLRIINSLLQLMIVGVCLSKACLCLDFMIGIFDVLQLLHLTYCQQILHHEESYYCASMFHSL